MARAHSPGSSANPFICITDVFCRVAPRSILCVLPKATLSGSPGPDLRAALDRYLGVTQQRGLERGPPTRSRLKGGGRRDAVRELVSGRPTAGEMETVTELSDYWAQFSCFLYGSGVGK